jgi:hypothetical protein
MGVSRDTALGGKLGKKGAGGGEVDVELEASGCSEGGMGEMDESGRAGDDGFGMALHGSSWLAGEGTRGG